MNEPLKVKMTPQRLLNQGCVQIFFLNVALNLSENLVHGIIKQAMTHYSEAHMAWENVITKWATVLPDELYKEAIQK